MKKWIICVALIVTWLSGSENLRAAIRWHRPNNAPASPGGAVNLPWTNGQTDASGNQWYVYQNGWIQTQGGAPVLNQGAMLIIGGNTPNQQNNTARIDDNGDLILDNMQGQGCTVTRRINISKDGYVRIVDIIQNTGAADATFQVSYRTGLNYGMQSSQTVDDPKIQGQSQAMIALDGQNRAVVEMFAGKGAKIAPTFGQQNGANWLLSNLAVPIPAGKSVALVHFHMVAASVEAGQKFVSEMKETQMLADLPREVRKIVANFRTNSGLLDDMEILRGDVFDVVELRSGDQLRGNLKETSYKLDTFYGPVELPIDKVIAMMNVGQFHPRQLVITADGEIFGGKLDKDTVQLELSSGQVTSIPVSQITRLGYRHRVGEKDEFPSDKPLVKLRAGDRMMVELPATPIAVATRYGELQLKPESIVSITFQSEDTSVNQIALIDGSTFSGLVVAPDFSMKLNDGVSNQDIKFPTGNAAMFQFKQAADTTDDSSPRLALSNHDLLIGTLSGQLKLDTSFDTLAIDANQIKKLTHAETSPSDVQITLWDDTTASGQLEEQSVSCELKSGLTVNVPVGMIDNYVQPRPTPSASMSDTIKDLVKKMDSDDYKERDRAQQQLTTLGTGAIGIMQQLRAAASPEVQQRIDTIIKVLTGPKTPPAAAVDPAAPPD